jgi:hypothetical protein
VRREPGASREDLLGTAGGTGDRGPCERACRTRIDAEDDVGIEDGNECLEVAVARRGEKCIDDLALMRKVCIGVGRGALDSASGTAGQLRAASVICR